MVQDFNSFFAGLLRFSLSLQKDYFSSKFRGILEIILNFGCVNKNQNKLRGFQSAKEIHQPSGSSLSTKLVSSFAVRGRCVVTETDPVDI